MSFSLDVSASPFRLRVEGQMSALDADELTFRFRTAATAPRRPSLLLDARNALISTLLWNKMRRGRLEALLKYVGPVAIVGTSPEVLNSIKLALHPFGSDVVWRMFTTLEEATRWLESVDAYGIRIWQPDLPTTPVPPERLDRLLRVVMTRGLSRNPRTCDFTGQVSSGKCRNRCSCARTPWP